MDADETIERIKKVEERGKRQIEKAEQESLRRLIKKSIGIDLMGND